MFVLTCIFIFSSVDQRNEMNYSKAYKIIDYISRNIVNPWEERVIRNFPAWAVADYQLYSR